MHPVRFGVFILPDSIAAAQAAAVKAEQQGFYSVSVNDHFYSPLGNAQSPQLECFTALTAMACVTERIRLVPAVAAMSFRNPAMLAKIMTCVDQASNGRFTCGLGAGWQPTEYHAHDYPFPSTPVRLEQLAEGLQICKAMWTEDEPTFTGKHFRIEKAYNNPRGVQKPHPPIMLGGSGTKLLKLAAREASIINLIPATGNGKDFVNDPIATVKFDMPTLKSRIDLLHQFMREAGRDPGEMEIGGLLLLGLSRDPNDPGLRALATQLGFPDYATAQASPVAILGTPEEARAELQKRVRETGMTYYIFVASSEESQDLFVEEVMPAFANMQG